MPDLDDIRAALARIPNPVAVLESLFALAPVGLQIYEASGRCLLVNQAFIDLFGSEPPPGYNVLRDEIAEQTGVLAMIHRAFRGESVTTPPIWYDPRELKQVKVEEGKRVAMQATFFPLFDRQRAVSHVGVVFRDVTAETLARETVERERELLSAVVEHTAEGIVVCDAEGRVRVVNESARRMGLARLDLSLEESQRLLPVERADGTTVSPEERPMSRAMRGEVAPDLVFRRGPDGRRALATTAVPLRGPDGSVRGAVMTVRDETERLEREAEAARTALFRERFIGILGHDLRSPLAAIAAGAGLIQRHEGLPPAVLRAATRTANTAMRMARMISDLLDFTQARLGGGLAVNRTKCDLRDLAQGALEEAQAAHPGRAGVLQVEGETKGRFDFDRVTQLFANLLQNAFSYSPAGTEVKVALKGEPDAVVISVSNRGTRIPPGELTSLFDPFRRGATSGGAHGVGLGLYIVQQIAVAHGGSASASSDDDETVFRVRLQR